MIDKDGESFPMIFETGKSLAASRMKIHIVQFGLVLPLHFLEGVSEVLVFFRKRFRFIQAL